MPHTLPTAFDSPRSATGMSVARDLSQATTLVPGRSSPTV